MKTWNGILKWADCRHLESGFMKRSLTLAGLALANALFAASSVYTNISGMVLGLEVSTTNLLAGEPLSGTMIISNASQTRVGVGWYRGGFNDTGIGNFVVMNEAGTILPNTLPNYLLGNRASMTSSRGSDFHPGASVRFEGDVVWNYSGLTNPGNYWVKATIPRVPSTNSQSPTTFQGETPWLAITVSPRPEGSPPAPHVYASYYAMIERMGPEERAIFEKEQQRVEALKRQMEKHAVPRAATKEVALPPKVQAGVGHPANASVPLRADEAGQAIGSRSRTMLYGSVVLLGIAALGLIVWRARRKEHAP